MTQINAKIICDSVSPLGKRLTTFELTYPRFIHSEFMTHRQFSRNAASSRAIPIETMIARVASDPALPIAWGKNQKGMQAEEELDLVDANRCEDASLRARDFCLKVAGQMRDRGAHKQLVNRILEPWSWITVICSATEYSNFFALRNHKDAQPEIQELAWQMWAAYTESLPCLKTMTGWHLPFIRVDDARDFHLPALQKLSVARCARVSYLTHDGKRDPQADFDLYDRLMHGAGDGIGHWSPFEHVARPLSYSQFESEAQLQGNFIGWAQYRKLFADECHHVYPVPPHRHGAGEDVALPGRSPNPPGRESA